MSTTQTEDIKQLIDSVKEFNLPLEKTRFDGWTEFDTVNQEVRKLEGLFVVLNNLPQADPDFSIILSEAKSLHLSIKMKLVSRQPLRSAG